MPPFYRNFLLLLLLLPFIPKAQFKENTIAWSPDKRLTWKDYDGEPDPGSDAAASTTTYLGIQYNVTNRVFGYSIECSFSKNSSWGRHKTAYILAHEQGHFDIAEYFARKLNMQMKNYQFNKSTYEKDLKKIYQDMQNQYDEETNHSIYKEKQVEWLGKIEKMLDDLKDYAEY